MKKFKLLAMALAFCMIASLIPAPIASADAANALYPEVVDLKFTFPESETAANILWNDLATSSINPTIANNEFEVVKQAGVTSTSKIYKTSPAFTPRLSKGGYIDLNVKAPSAAGKYAMLIEGITTITNVAALAVTVDGKTVIIDNANTLKSAKVCDITINGTEDKIAITIGNPGNAQNVTLAKIIFVPVGDVYASFINSNTTTYTTADTVFANLKYEVNGLEKIDYSLADKRVQISAANFYFRANAGNYITFGVYVPEDGVYSGIIKALKLTANYGILDVYVDNVLKGSMNTYADSPAASVNTDFEFDSTVELTAGLHEIKIQCKENTSTASTTYNRIVDLKLSKVAELKAEIPESEIFGDTYAYVKDGTVYFLGGLKVIEGYTEVGFEVSVNGGAAEYISTSEVYEEFAVTAENVSKSAADWDSEYIFITSKSGLNAGDVITLKPYVANGEAKTFHGELELKLSI